MKNSFRLLILGSGPVLVQLHLHALRTLGWLESSLAVDLSSQSLEQLRSEAPSLRSVQEDFRVVLADRELVSQFDGALICLPNSLHASAVGLALHAGLHVLCEKPLAMSGTDCEQLLETARRVDRSLWVAMVMRHLPGLKSMRQAINDGMIGEVNGVDAEDGNPFEWDSTSGGYFTTANGGVLLNMGVHFLDIIRWLVGPLQPVSYSDDAKGGAEANFEFQLQSNAIPVRLEVSYTRKLRNTILVKGTLGSLEFDKASPGECVWSKGTLKGRLETDDAYFHGAWMPSMYACYAEQLAAFAAHVKGKDVRAELVDVEEAVATGRLIDWAMDNRTAYHDSIYRVAVSPELTRKINGSVAVTGATGFVGSRLVSALCDCPNVQVKAVVRSFRSGAAIGRFPIERKLADLLDVESLRQAFQGVRHVFHLAYGSDGKRSRDITVEGSLNVCRAASRAGVESVVVVGTTAVYGPQPQGTIVNEEFPLRKHGNDYELEKAEMARKVIEFSKSSDAGSTRITVIEPACIYGPGGKPFTELPVQLAKSGEFVWVEEGRGTANVVYVDSLIDALIRSVIIPQSHQQRIIVQDIALTWKEFLTPLLGKYALNIPSRSLHQLQKPNPTGLKDVFKAALQSPELVKKFTSWPWGFRIRRLIEKFARSKIDELRRARRPEAIREVGLSNPDQPLISPPIWLATAFGMESPPLSNAKAKTILEWKPYPFEDGMDHTIAWLKHAKLLVDE